VLVYWYRQTPAKLMNKEADINSDSLKMTLHNSSYTPNRDTHAYVSDLTNELATAGGYTAGGSTLTGAAITTVVANSWATARANSTAYAVGDVVRPATGNGFLYRCAVAGTTAASIPTYPITVGLTVVDGGVTWENIGSLITVFTTDAAVWAALQSSVSTIRYGVIADYTPVSNATRPLLVLIDFEANQSGAGGNFTVGPVAAAAGWLQIAVP